MSLSLAERGARTASSCTVSPLYTIWEPFGNPMSMVSTAVAVVTAHSAYLPLWAVARTVAWPPGCFAVTRPVSGATPFPRSKIMAKAPGSQAAEKDAARTGKYPARAAFEITAELGS